MIKASDNKWRVSVDGQLDMPFISEEEAQSFAAAMIAEGLDAYIYFSPAPLTWWQRIKAKWWIFKIMSSR